MDVVFKPKGLNNRSFSAREPRYNRKQKTEGKNMNLKKLLALAMCAVLVLGMVACGNTTADPDEGKNADGVIELKIPSYKSGENVGAVFFLPQVERFNAKYEGQYKITIETTAQDSFSDMLKQLAQQKALPVLVQGGDADWIKNVVIPNGLAYDLSSWLAETPAVKDVLLADSLEYCTVDGATYVLPLATVRATGYFYNSAMWNPSVDLSTLDALYKSCGVCLFVLAHFTSYNTLEVHLFSAYVGITFF